MDYPEDDLTLLAVRDTKTGEETHLNFVTTNIPKIKTLSIKTLDEINKSLEYMSPMKQEGYVIVDNLYRRIKMKSPKYVLVHKMRNKVTPRGLIELIRENEVSEFTTYFPEYKKNVDDLMDKIETLVLDLHDFYGKIEKIESQKDFAIQAVKHPASSALFAMRTGKTNTFYSFLLHNIHVDRLLTILETVKPIPSSKGFYVAPSNLSSRA